jgi:hypothetical protein
MSGIDNDALLDLVATTLKDLPKGQFEVMWTHQNYEFAQIYNEQRRQIDGGTSIQRNVVFDHTGNARYRRLFDTDQPSVDNIQHQIDVPWTQVGTHYSWDVLEIRRNKNSAKGYINLLETRRMDGLWALADLIEDRGWKTPLNATDKLNPYGIPYYLNMLDAGSTVGGFNGKTVRYQDGSAGTIVAGIDGATEAKWRNYADVYVKIDNALLRKMRKAFLLTRFKAPPGVNSPGQDAPGSSVKIYCNADASVEFMDLADKRDDNNTPKDLAGKVLVDVEGATFFNRRPIVYVPPLDGVDFDPIYCVDWSKIQPIVQDGYWMVESKPMMDRGQHTTITVFVDGSHQNLCINRKTAGFVMHKAIPA